MTRWLVVLLALSVAGCGMVGRRGPSRRDRPPPAATSPSTATGPIATGAPVAGPIATNDRPVEATPLDEDQIPDAPPPPPLPPDPTVFGRAIAPESIKRAKPLRADLSISPDQVRTRLQDKLTSLGFPALQSVGKTLISGPTLRNTGGFANAADCAVGAAAGRPRMVAAWVEASIDSRRRGSEIELLARFEEVRESPIRDVLVRVDCPSTGRLEDELLAALR